MEVGYERCVRTRIEIHHTICIFETVSESVLQGTVGLASTSCMNVSRISSDGMTDVVEYQVLLMHKPMVSHD